MISTLMDMSTTFLFFTLSITVKMSSLKYKSQELKGVLENWCRHVAVFKYLCINRYIQSQQLNRKTKIPRTTFIVKSGNNVNIHKVNIHKDAYEFWDIVNGTKKQQQ